MKINEYRKAAPHRSATKKPSYLDPRSPFSKYKNHCYLFKSRMNFWEAHTTATKWNPLKVYFIVNDTNLQIKKISRMKSNAKQNHREPYTKIAIISACSKVGYTRLFWSVNVIFVVSYIGTYMLITRHIETSAYLYCQHFINTYIYGNSW